MTQLSLRLLGEFEVFLDDRRLTGFETIKVRALLAYLVVEAGRSHQREVLAGLLWPDVSGEAARTYLRQGLANLREVLSDRSVDPSFLLITREAIQFNTNSDHALDLTAFATLLATCARHAHRQPALCARCAQQLEAAVDLYRGPLLDHFSPGDSTAFEEWAALKREGLHQQAVGVLTRLADYHERRGAYDDVRRVAWRQLDLDPWREEAHRQLMRALWHNGERSAALAQYERCRETLRAELGVEPAPETTALYTKIRSATAVASTHDRHRATVPQSTLLPDTTPLIGREAELVRLGDLLANPGCQLLTLVGPGGIGKTRLASQVGRDHLAAFAHGVVFVPLVAVPTAAGIVPAIAQALQITLLRREDPQVQLFTHLHGKELLLILDNMDHLQSGGGMLAQLMQQAPGVTLLVTSRERMHLREEWVVEVEGLAYPVSARMDTQEQYSAIRLFLESACRAQGGRELPIDEHDAVSRICQLVRGVPLAIELAATWVRMLPCAEIATELERTLDVLILPSNGVEERHQSMRAVFEHSWQLLSAEEQQFLPQLAVFRGGWERAAALDVTGAGLLILAALVDKSLLRRAGEGRYDVHELLRQYAEEQLVKTGQEEQTRDRHLHHYLHLAEQAEPHLFRAEQEVWLTVLETEHDNMRAALRWSVERRETESAMRLAGALWWFWWVRGYVHEGRGWLSAVLAMSGAAPIQVQAKALHGAGWLAVQQREYALATMQLEQSLALAEKAKDTRRAVAVIHDLAQCARLQGDHRRAHLLYERSATLGYELGDKHIIGWSLGGLGVIAHAEGDHARAVELLETSVALMQELDDKIYQAWFLSFLGREANGQNTTIDAGRHHAESLRLFRDTMDKDGIAFALEGFGGYAAAQGNSERSARIFGAAEALREAIDSPMAPFDQPEYGRDLDIARAQLDQEMFAAAWVEGRAMMLEQAVGYALAQDDYAHTDNVVDDLQRQIKRR